ncbi:Lysidine-tRNA(Ile) synthetase [Cynara cardunculus var. scolymus]|uniref:tRNA(Ile)-lysidine synthetase n=1 Tax=Cynara cardunculus var. scolymus TaxID=59895 RepID=A0A124SCI6_CYNCS|nr:Lysidine-tRNA(Ile) synthetase [Cynara cardunculus var. scolymus]
MARGLLLLPHYTAKSHLIRTGLSSSSTNFTKIPIFPTSRNPTSVRVLCSCSSNGGYEFIGLSKYKDTFSKRMAMAGLKPHHRIAVGVSGGPDSMALCLLVADWKSCGLNVASNGNNDMVDGLLAIIVDHGLRSESKDEAEMVQRRVLDIGIRCEIAHCKWYEKLQHICSRHQIGVLLIAHHADDQAELFILRLSRNSGVLGLAGMALATQLFATNPSLDDGSSSSILVVRPLLDFSKQDLYKVGYCFCAYDFLFLANSNCCSNDCFSDKNSYFIGRYVKGANRIGWKIPRIKIQYLHVIGSECRWETCHHVTIFKSELQAIISACRRTRFYVDQICHTLINQSVTVMPQGYVIIDLGILNPLKVPDICLSKFVTLLLQFISQRQRPVRGSAQKLLLDYFRTFPCKSSFTAAGCYLCAAPGSKGTKLLICCSVNSALPMKTESFYIGSSNKQKVNIITELEQIIEDGRSYSNKMVPKASDVPFLNAISSESILTEAKRLKILGEPTLISIQSLHKIELEKFKFKTETLTENVSQKVVESVDAKELGQGQIGHFMDRFVVSWKFIGENGGCYCGFGQYSVVEVRHMVDADWLDLSRLSKSDNLEDCQLEEVLKCSDYAKISARKALRLLKSIPVAARRSLPVLVDPRWQVLSIPSVCFSVCRCLKASVEFSPRVPLGGGYSSFL